LFIIEISIIGLEIVKAEIEKKIKKDYIIKLIKIKKAKILNINAFSIVKQAIFKKIAINI